MADEIGNVIISEGSCNGRGKMLALISIFNALHRGDAFSVLASL